VNNMVIALDIETKNLSTEIGGWGNTHMFVVSTVATWDGQIGKIYVEKDITDKIVAKSNTQVLPMRQLKYDLDDIYKSGQKLLGHNIAAFDLPVLRDSLDIYCVRKFLNDNQYIDTSRELTKQYGERFRLQNLVDNTLGETKSLESVMAPSLWKAGEYQEVVDYCLKDCKLVYDLYKYGQENMLKAFSIEKEEFVELKMEW
tara:strand:+ start:1470 stop:2072 length:603 start_codon:yes stop_codon:yes gene_type:complete